MVFYREEFEALGDKIYLNHAGIGPCPKSAYDAINAFNKGIASGNSNHSEAFKTVGDCKALIGQLVNVPPEYISLSGNTSMGLNYVAASYPFAKGDRVLIIDRQFPAVVHPWLNQKQRGVVCEFVPSDPYPDLELTLSIIDRRTKFVVISWVRFFDGYRVNLKEWADALHERGVYLAVDGMQGCGAIPVDLTDCRVDVFSAGGAKWLLSPLGTGFLYVAPELRDELKPVFAGWLQMLESDDFSTFLDYDYHIPPDGRRFEVATYPFMLLYGMREALKILLDANPSRIAPHIFGLLDALISQLDNVSDYRIKSCLDENARSGILSIETPEGPEVAERLAGNGIRVSYREGGLRISPHLYNTKEDIAKLVAALLKHS